MTELKSLKNPTRILSILMFIAVIITSIGADALGEALPFVPHAMLVGFVGACAWAVNQYGTESRIVREDIQYNELKKVYDLYWRGYSQKSINGITGLSLKQIRKRMKRFRVSTDPETLEKLQKTRIHRKI